MENFVKMAVNGGELLYNSNEISKVIRKIKIFSIYKSIFTKEIFSIISENQLEIIILTIARNIYFWYDDLQQFVK